MAVPILLAGACSGDPSVSELSMGWDSICGADAESSWRDVPIEGRSFGRRDEEWLEDVFGVAATGDDIWVLDQGRGLVRVAADGTFLEVTREGRGPGELRLAQSFGGDWITASNSEIVVFDGARFSWFDANGAFLAGVDGVPGIDPFLTDRIAPSPRGVWAGAVTALPQTGDRTLRIAEVGREGLLRELDFALPPLPEVDGTRVPVVPRQALPSWDAAGPCVYVTDGAGLLIRAHVERARWDTLRLPERELPRLGDADREALARVAAFSPSLTLASLEAAEPTLVARWSDLRVDPNGHVWVKRWESRAVEDEDDWALIVDGTGEMMDRRVPRFPAAFGRDGVLLHVGQDEETGAPVVEILTPEDR